MVHFAQQVTFLLNDELVKTDVPPGLLALDYVRQRRQLTGTKEGCKEGDCGACTVIVGELLSDGCLRYRPMTSCLLPMGELQGKHLVTIEGLNMKGLSPVQQAMVKCGGSQCGYCTSGFIVAMTAGLMEPKVALNKEGMLYAISGNLCRCTGYRSIKEAGMEAIDSLAEKLADKDRIAALCDAGALPEYFRMIAERLKVLQINRSEALETVQGGGLENRIVIAGGTDLYVQRGEAIPEKPVNLLNTLKEIEPVCLREDRLIVDARMTFEAFAEDPLIQSYLPTMADYNLLIASWPVRTRSSLGGNICNASPIADMVCLLLALDTELTLSLKQVKRKLLLKDFYLGYKQLAKESDELVVELSFPVPKAESRVNWEKVSKRAWLDIATVNSAARIDVVDGMIQKASIALGGVAATPLYLDRASASLAEVPLGFEAVGNAIEIALSEFDPISDVRGTATYKRLLARQLLWAHFVKLYPAVFREEVICEALR